MTDAEFDAVLKEICGDLAVEIKNGKRMDVREKVAAISALIKARELWGKDERSAGATARQYEGLFQKTADSAGREADPGSATGDDDREGVGDAGNGSDPETCVPRNTA